MNERELWEYYPDGGEFSPAGLAMYRSRQYRIFTKVSNHHLIFKVRDGSRWIDETFASLDEIDEWMTEQEEWEDL